MASVLDRIPRYIQLAAAVVTLVGGTLAVLNFAPFDDSAPTATPRPTPTPTLGTGSPPSAGEFPGTRDTILSEPPNVPPVAILTDIRISSESGFDRVVFEFRDNFPGYRVEYVQNPQEEFSGRDLEIGGEAYLQVRLDGAQAHVDGESTLEDRRYEPGSASVLELALTGDAGGRVTTVIGLVQPLDFRVDRAIDPFRVIVEVAHP